MDCPNCGEPVETGAAFCGNCGQPVAAPQPVPHGPVAAPSVQPVATNLPVYAIPQPKQQGGQLKAAMAVVVGSLGIVAALVLPLVGLLLGIAGLVLVTLAWRFVRKPARSFGVIMPSLALLAGLGTWTYAVAHPATGQQPGASGTVSAQNTASVRTPCYNVSFPKHYNVEHAQNSCDLNAYDGDSLNTSSDAYKVYAVNTSVSPAGFAVMAKQAIEKDIAQSLPSFTITDEGAGSFAGSQAYFVTTSNGKGVTLVEAVVLHQTSQGQNFFVFVHAINGVHVNLDDLQSGWQWE